MNAVIETQSESTALTVAQRAVIAIGISAEREQKLALRQAAEEQARRDARAAMASRKRPDAAEIADAVSEAFGVDSDIAAGWIAEVPHGDWVALTITE